MYCSHCGGALVHQSPFCPQCGARAAAPHPPAPGQAAWSHSPLIEPAGRGPAHGRRAGWLALTAAVVIVVGGGTAGVLALSHRTEHPADAARTTSTSIAPPASTTPSASTPSSPSSSAVVPLIKTVTVAPPVRTTPPVAVKTVTPSPTPPATTARPVLDFAAIYKKQQSGVIRIETISCSASGVGTGFLLSPTLIATVDHVVSDSAVVSLINGDHRTTGTVIGSDPVHDLALVRADEPLSG